MASLDPVDLTGRYEPRSILFMTRGGNQTFEVICPCCNALLSVDAALGQVIAHQPPSKPTKPPDLDGATKLLQKEAQRREAMFQQSAEQEKVKTQLLERKFEEALRKTKDEPVTRPTRDIDLD